MARASYLWNRGSSIWFQMAVPLDLESLLGRTPIRLRLPTRRVDEAGHIARILVGTVERWRSEMRFKGFTAAGIAQGHFPNGRKRLLDALIKEVDEISATVADWDRVTQKRKPRTDHETLKLVQERNEVLESVILNLKQKAIDISKEYADFFEQSIRQNSANTEQAEQSRDNFDHFYQHLDETNQAKLKVEKTLTETQGSLQSLQDVVVAGSELRNQLETHSIETLKHATSALNENRKLRESNEALNERLSYKGPLLSEAKERFIDDRRLRGVAEHEVAQLSKKIDDFIMLIGDKAVGE